MSRLSKCLPKGSSTYELQGIAPVSAIASDGRGVKFRCITVLYMLLQSGVNPNAILAMLKKEDHDTFLEVNFRQFTHS